MQNENTLTEKDFGFLLLCGDAEVPAEFFGQIVSEEKGIVLKMFNSPWLMYQPTGDEYMYCYNIPGTKLIIRGDINFDQAKSIADDIVTKLKSESGQNIDLVIVDSSRLTEVNE